MKHQHRGATSSALSPFKTTFDNIAYRGSYDKVFDDFLTICICAYTRNFPTGLSYYEDEYLSIIEPYKKDGTLKHFPELLAHLVLYMEEYKDSSEGNDLLGQFFEAELGRGRKGQFFTPFHVCTMMSQILRGEETKSVNVLDPACGSGRMLLAFAKQSKLIHGYYGVDIDPVCVKMTAVNMFLNGLRGEVICADFLASGDFRLGYRVSIIPLGIFKIEDKEASFIWQSQQFQSAQKSSKLTLPSERGDKGGEGSQLQMF